MTCNLLSSTSSTCLDAKPYEDHYGLLEITLSTKAVAHYGTTMTDNDHSPTPILRKHCHNWRKGDEGKWHCLIDLPLYQRNDKGDRIVTTKYSELDSTHKESLRKKVSESPKKKARVTESPSEKPRLADPPVFHGNIK